MLELYDGKLSRTVLRGERGREASDLPGGGNYQAIFLRQAGNKNRNMDMIKNIIIHSLFFLFFLWTASIAYIPPYPPTTLMEYTNGSEIIVIGKITKSEIRNRAPVQLCYSTLEAEKYLKGKGKKKLKFYNQRFPLSVFPRNQNNCDSLIDIRLIVFLSVHNDTLFDKVSFLYDGYNKNDLLNAIQEYIEIEKIINKKKRNKAYASLLINFLKNDSLRREALYCLWNATEEKAEPNRKNIIPYQDIFEGAEQSEIVKIAKSLKANNNFEINLLEFAYKYNAKEIGKRMIEIIREDINCSETKMDGDKIFDKEYFAAKKRLIEVKTMTFLCKMTLNEKCDSLLNLFKMEKDCNYLNEVKHKYLKIFEYNLQAMMPDLKNKEGEL